MFPGLRKSAEFLADVGQVVVRVGVLGIELHGVAQVLTCLLAFAEFVENASQI